MLRVLRLQLSYAVLPVLVQPLILLIQLALSIYLMVLKHLSALLPSMVVLEQLMVLISLMPLLPRILLLQLGDEDDVLGLC